MNKETFSLKTNIIKRKHIWYAISSYKIFNLHDFTDNYYYDANTKQLNYEIK